MHVWFLLINNTNEYATACFGTARRHSDFSLRAVELLGTVHLEHRGFLRRWGANSSKKILTSKYNKQTKDGKGQLNSQVIKFMKLRSDHLTSISLSFSLGVLQLLTCFRKVGVQLHLYSLLRKMFAAKKGRGGHPPGPSWCYVHGFWRPP